MKHSDMSIPALWDMDVVELENFLGRLGQPAYRARQIARGLYAGRSLDEMSDLPLALREALVDSARFGGVSISEEHPSADAQSVKYLFFLDDCNIIEGVFMRHAHGNTLCVSSQAGCAMGCAFCASTRGGLIRNLTAGEMLSQVAFANRKHATDGRRGVDNIVIMGSGEPLENYDNTLEFVRRASSPEGMGIGIRNITLSTCGIISGIKRLMGEGLKLNLAISLHAPDDATRMRLMPSARGNPMYELMRCAREYQAQSGRRVSLEYALIDGVNDSPQMAEKLAALISGCAMHVNLIELNGVEGTGLRPSGRKVSELFRRTLERTGVNVTARRSLGADIGGACGQLKAARG